MQITSQKILLRIQPTTFWIINSINLRRVEKSQNVFNEYQSNQKKNSCAPTSLYPKLTLVLKKPALYVTTKSQWGLLLLECNYPNTSPNKRTSLPLLATKLIPKPLFLRNDYPSSRPITTWVRRHTPRKSSEFGVEEPLTACETNNVKKVTNFWSQHRPVRLIPTLFIYFSKKKYQGSIRRSRHTSFKYFKTE